MPGFDEDAREITRLEGELRAARPRPRDSFVAALAGRATSPAPSFRGSRIAFSLAFSVFLIGSFTAFGGLGYASAGAKSVAKVVIHPSKATVRRTSASAQYAVPPPPTGTHVSGAGKQLGVAGTSRSLPFTGISLVLTVAIGAALLAAGLVLRVRERRG
jgi:hypothetical protein